MKLIRTWQKFDPSGFINSSSNGITDLHTTVREVLEPLTKTVIFCSRWLQFLMGQDAVGLEVQIMQAMYGVPVINYCAHVKQAF